MTLWNSPRLARMLPRLKRGLSVAEQSNFSGPGPGAIARRGLLGMFAAGAAAAIVRTPGLLMPIKAAFQPSTSLWLVSWGTATTYGISPCASALRDCAELAKARADLNVFGAGAYFTGPDGVHHLPAGDMFA